MPVSIPTPKPQPDAAIYGIAELELFARDTRATYLQRNGVQAQPFDPSRPVQRWFDTTVADQPQDDVYIVQYFEVLDDGGITRRRKGITNRDASTPNLPGPYQYPRARVLQPSGVWISKSLIDPTETGGKHYIPADQLSSQQEAIAMRDTLRANGFQMFDGLAEFYDAIHQDAGETRRPWAVICSSGDTWSVGQLRMQSDKFGVGSPGHWEKNINGSPNFVSDIVASLENDPLPTLPVPQRTLLPNERLKIGFGGNIQVLRTDKTEVVELDDSKAMPGRVRELLEILKQIQADLKAA